MEVLKEKRDNVLPHTDSEDKNEVDWDMLDSIQGNLDDLDAGEHLKSKTKLSELDNRLASERGFSKDLQNLNDEDCVETYDSYLSQHRDNYFLSTDGDLLAIE